MATEYRKYDSAATLVFHNARVTGDVKVISDTFVKVPVVMTSSNEGDDDMWLDVVPFDGQAPIAGFIEKGDLISFEGFLTQQTWGEDKDKTSHTVKRARIHMSPEYIATLKERGFTPGGGGKSKGKGGKVSKPAKGGKPAKREIAIPDDDDGE